MSSDFLPAPDYMVEVIDCRTGRSVIRYIRISPTSAQMAVNIDGRVKAFEYAVSQEAKYAFRDLEALRAPSN
jgi:hypothetical protein